MTDAVAPLRIAEIAEKLNLTDEDWEPRGHYQAKLHLGLLEELLDRPQGKYIGVTAISPTPLGEGKTITTIGLAMALERLGNRTLANLREPSLAPMFGIKGGGAGAGKTSLFPADEINLHFTGDLHAVTAANNLLAAMIDNHLKRKRQPLIDMDSVTWQRTIDMSDRGLSSIMTGLDDPPQAPKRETGFDLTAASEVMAILSLAKNLPELRQRLGRIVVGISPDREAVTAEHIGAAGSMAALLRNAFQPNLVQTCEQTPALVHAGPFANIAHGNSSVVADLIGLRLADYVVTESGFGADCGAEKLMHIKCRASGLVPDVEVLVCTVRALKVHSGKFDVRPGRALPEDLLSEDLAALEAGAANLQAHIEIVHQFGLPVVVAINRFPTDTDRELEALARIAKEAGAEAVAIHEAFSRGSEGAVELAEAVVDVCRQPKQFRVLYELDDTLQHKIETIARKVYGADGVDFDEHALQRIAHYERLGFSELPICIAKTQYSLSHDPKLLGRPTGFRFPIRDVRLAAGAGYLYALAGEIRTMPGLSRNPAALNIDIDANGNIIGMK